MVKIHAVKAGRIEEARVGKDEILCEELQETLAGGPRAELAPGGRKGFSSGTEEEDSGKPWCKQIWKRGWEVEGVLHVLTYHM